MGIMLYPGLMDPDMAGEAERRSPPSSRGQDMTAMLVTISPTVLEHWPSSSVQHNGGFLKQ